MSDEAKVEVIEDDPVADDTLEPRLAALEEGFASLAQMVGDLADSISDLKSRSVALATREDPLEHLDRKLAEMQQQLEGQIDYKKQEWMQGDSEVFPCPVCNKMNRAHQQKDHLGNPAEPLERAKARVVCAHCGINLGNERIVERALRAQKEGW